MADSFDLIVVGGGPGGYVCAIRAAQLGFKVACIDENELFGGTCLRVGCIPSKALLESSELFHQAQSGLKQHGILVGDVVCDVSTMLRRKSRVVTTLGRGVSGLLKNNQVEAIQGTAKLLGQGKVEVALAKGGSQVLEGKNIVIATGSAPASLPGVEIDEDRIGSSTAALSYEKVPPRLIVIGAGAIGLELGSVWSRLGSQVTVLEYLDRILPGMDGEIAKATQKILAKQGLKFQLGTRVESVKVVGEEVEVRVSDREEPFVCDRVLVSVGRRPYTDGLGLDEIGVKRDRRGFIEVDEHLRTNVEGVYAIGDVIGGAMLAHKAEEEGVALAERLKTGVGHVDYGLVPAVVYTHPEVASVGKTTEELEAEGIPFKVGTFPFAANGRARAVNAMEGMVKILAHAKTDRVLGVHILGAHAGDLLTESVVAMNFGASAEDLARICHAHPTMSEATKEAALAVDGRAIHS